MKLMEQQAACIDKLKKWKVGALFMEAGTGKTRVARELITIVEDIDLIVWAGPYQTIHSKNGFATVKDEIDKWGGVQCEIVYIGVESLSASERIYLELEERMRRAKNIFMVVDESLKIKNAGAKRTRRLIELGRMAKYKLILNGTPLSRNILDLWSQMEFLSPKILGMTLSQFKNTFCCYTTVIRKFSMMKQYRKEYVTGYENIDYLYSLIRHYVFSCDLNLNIKQTYEEVYYELDDDMLDDYYDIKNHYLGHEEWFWRSENIFFAMTQDLQHSYCLCESKFRAVNELFTRFPEEETIIFCKYIDSKEECMKRYPKAKVLTYQKESLGLNMQQYHHTVYFDKNWDYALRIQSGRRTFRTGQEYDCYYYDLTGNVGLERMIDRNISSKKSMADYIKNVSYEDLKQEL